ncbi:MAG: tetratricopeptide repeat protein [Pseudomonadota bacterium]
MRLFTIKVAVLVCVLSCSVAHATSPTDRLLPTLPAIECAGVSARTVQQAAMFGDASAQYRLFELIGDGTCSSKSSDAALLMLRSASNQGHPAASFELAARIAAGDGVPPNVDEALRLFELAGDAGHVLAQHHAGLIHLRLSKTSQRRETGLLWLGRAAANGHGLSALVLGLLHERGLYGVTQDRCVASHWYDASFLLGQREGRAFALRLEAVGACQ